MKLKNEAYIFISETRKTGIRKTIYIRISEIPDLSRIRFEKRPYYVKQSAFAGTRLACYGESISFFYFQIGFIQNINRFVSGCKYFTDLF